MNRKKGMTRVKRLSAAVLALISLFSIFFTPAAFAGTGSHTPYGSSYDSCTDFGQYRDYEAYLYKVGGCAAYCVDPYLTTPALGSVMYDCGTISTTAFPNNPSMYNAILSTYDCKNGRAAEVPVYADNGTLLDQDQMLARILIQEASLLDPWGDYWLYYDPGSRTMIHSFGAVEPLLSNGGYYVEYGHTAMIANTWNSYAFCSSPYYASYNGSYQQGSVLTDVYEHLTGVSDTHVVLGDATLQWNTSQNKYTGSLTCDNPSIRYLIDSGALDKSGLTFRFDSSTGRINVSATQSAVDSYFSGGKCQIQGLSNKVYTVGDYGYDAGSPAFLSNSCIHLLRCGDGSKQAMIQARNIEWYDRFSTGSFYLYVEEKNGGLNVVKSSPDGKVSGWTFRLTGNGHSYSAVTDSSGMAKFADIPAGSYTLSEDGDWTKYVQVQPISVTITAGSTITKNISNTPLAKLEVRKTGDDNLIKGMTFILSQNGSEKARATTDSNGIATFTVAPGSYTLSEVAGGKYKEISKQVTVSSGTTGMTLDFHNNLKPEYLGRIDILKKDAETENKGLKGAVFEVLNKSGKDLRINGNAYKNGSVVTTLTTDARGAATTGSILPFGTYGVREKTAPSGYIPESEEMTLTVSDYSQTLSAEFSNRIIRGNLIFTKTDAVTKEGLEGMVFRISLVDGTGKKLESHIAVTGPDGIFDSAKLLEGDKTRINANDEAVDSEGNVDISKLDPEAPLWFYGEGIAEEDYTGDYTQGAFPYGTYLVEELNPGEYVEMDPFEIAMRLEDGHTYRYSLKNYAKPDISSLLTDENGEKKAEAKKALKLTDSVFLEGLEKGKKYRMTGYLADAATGMPLTDSQGKEIKPAEKTFTAEESSVTYELSYTFDAVEMSGTDAVAFVTLERIPALPYIPVITAAAHEDVNDKDQTIHIGIPAVNTFAETDDGRKVIKCLPAEIIDTVVYENLDPGTEYRLEGVLMNKDTEEPVTDREGNPVTTSATFTPEERDGETEMAFILDNPDYDGADIVVFESLYIEDELMAEHCDINDEAQAVFVDLEYFLKTDQEGELLEGAVIEVTDKTANVTVELTSDIDGRLYYELAPNHKYMYRETKAPEGYLLDKSVYSFETDEYAIPDIGYVIVNRPVGTAEILKRDVLTGEPIEGAQITVYDSTGTAVYSAKTDGAGKIYFDASAYIRESKEGVTFKAKETTAPKGYYLNSDDISFTVAPNGKVTGTLVIDDVPEGTVAIRKTDQNGAVLPGARLSVYSQDGKLQGQATTGTTGRIYFSPPNAGTYYFVEDAAPQGYERNTQKHTFSITAAGQISGTVTMINKRVPSGATGDRRNLKAAAVTAAVLGTAAAVAGTYGFTRRKKHGPD